MSCLSRCPDCGNHQYIIIHVYVGTRAQELLECVSHDIKEALKYVSHDSHMEHDRERANDNDSLKQISKLINTLILQSLHSGT